MKILLAESNDKNAEWFHENLQKIPMDYERVKTFQATKKLVEKNNYDVVILSLNLTDHKGLECLKELKSIIPKKPIVVSVLPKAEKKAYEGVQKGAQGFFLIGTIGDQAMAAVIHQAIMRQNALNESLEKQMQLATIISNLSGFVYRCRNDRDWTMEYISGGFKSITGYDPADVLENKKLSYAEIIHPKDRKVVWDEIQKAIKKDKHFQIEYRINTTSGEEKWIWEQGRTVGLNAKSHMLEGYATDITDKKSREMQMQAVVSISLILRNAMRKKEFSQGLVEKIGELFETRCVALLMITGKLGFIQIEYGLDELGESSGREIDIRECLCFSTLKENKIVSIDLEKDRAKVCNIFANQTCRFVVFIPLANQRKVSGLIAIGRERAFTEKELEVVGAIADMVAAAVERSNLYQKTEKQLKRLESLHAIDQAITSVYDIQVVNKIILDQVCRELEADAADILILNSASNMLEYKGANGFVDQRIRDTRVPLTTSIAGKVLLENQGYSSTNLDENPLWYIREKMQVENFKSYFSKPLTNKGEAIGVMEIFFRKTFMPDWDWESFFEALATQAAVAYDSYRKYTDLQKIQQNMASSFRSTIETWSKSLELHDIESQGHIQRVTNSTIHLARELGVNEEELPNVERGALLHDIGKIGIMDEILQKKGSLTDSEWDEIKRHPQIARDLLKNVKMLKDALDIPYSHHENWDGSGYPQGLKGEEIPLPARIFAVVETYDALTSPRPYRKAWSPQEAVAYLKEQKGKKFDSAVVDKFLEHIQKH